MRFLYFYPISFFLFVFPAALFAAESLDERLFSELRLINQSMSKLASENEAFIKELDRERCMKAARQRNAPMNPSCEEQSLKHLATLDESNGKSEVYVKQMVEGWAKVYGMLRVAHMQCDLNSINFEAVPTSLRAQSRLVELDPDDVLLEYIEASEGALDEDLNDLDCGAIKSFTATVQQIVIAARRAQERMR
ncbi:hypothetical protein [Marinobacter salicampi]|uniref:hypothetical protein n=1 Tax=Marinobacter salicampi TaxID=435907 RepID=UPI001409F17F|nr:hypothetical protein [Marinobacter salicampi]